MTGPGPRRGERTLIEGPRGGVYARTRGNRVHLRAYLVSGDKLEEMKLAAQAASLYREVFRSMTGTDVELVGLTLRNDHPATLP